MSEVICEPILNWETLSATQEVDLQIAIKVTNAFWAAVSIDPFWKESPTPAVNCCIMGALAVRDILHKVGRKDAYVVRSGLKVSAITDRRLNSITIGAPCAPKVNGLWNAHMTVRLGDILIDPTFGQTKRPWNESPVAVAFLVNNVKIPKIEIQPRCKVSVASQHRFYFKTTDNLVTYFELPSSVDARTRDWGNAPDARLDRRLSLVAAASVSFKPQAKAA